MSANLMVVLWIFGFYMIFLVILIGLRIAELKYRL